MGPTMAHRKSLGTTTKVLAPSSSSGPGAARAKLSQKEQQALVWEATQQPSCSMKGDNKDQLTPPVSAKHAYVSCDPNPEDMEDTCSEYDNVGSDVEQDYDEVLHLNRDGVVDMRYYKHYCPEDEKHTVCENNNENTAAAAVEAAAGHITQRPCRGTEKSEGSQSDTKQNNTGHRFRPHCVMIAREEVEEGVIKSQGDRFFLNDGDDLEEVLDGVRFIEDLEDTENHVQRQTSFCQDENDRIRKGRSERERDEGPRVTRKHNIPEASRKYEPSHMVSKEKGRQCKGQGKRATGEDAEPMLPVMKGCVTEQRPKASSKDCKKSAVKSKVRAGSSKQHPPPPPCQSHVQSTPDIQQAQPHKETLPVTRPSPSTACRHESEPRVIKPPLAPHHTPEEEREIPEKRQEDSEKPEQVQIQIVPPTLTFDCCCLCL